MNLHGPLVLSEDVLLIPVRELPEESRARLDCAEEDFAVSRLQGRSGSKIVDAQAASLLERFREPRTVVDAVILFSRERRLDPEDVLDGAFPLLEGLAAAGFLVPVDGEGGAAAPRGGATWSEGAWVDGARVERCLQVLDDTEVYVVARGTARSVLKVERRPRGALESDGAGAPLGHEARFLAHLGGEGAPALLACGAIEGHECLELEFVAGVDAAAAAAEWRERAGGTGRRGLLALLRRISEAYAVLHARGVVHGDVHPRNVLVDRDGGVRLIDFGVARGIDPNGVLPVDAPRGGVPFFYEPELARAALETFPPPPASPAGEQFAVASLLYQLATGAHWRDFSLGRDAMLREICAEEPLPFVERGVEAWPELETVLWRALRKPPGARFAGLREFSDALAAVDIPASPAGRAPGLPVLDRLRRGAVENAGLDGPWLEQGLGLPPTVSVNYGAAGLALGLLQIAQRSDDPALLAAADVWARRAARGLGEEGAFYNSDIQITREVVGESALYHSPCGVHAARALVARALADPAAQEEAVASFLAAAEAPSAGFDLALGRAGNLLGAAILLDAAPLGAFDTTALRAFGERLLGELWRHLDGKPEIARADVEYPGLAHGWAGFLYSTLVWCRVAGSPSPAGAERRLDELAALARVVGRGLQWPWVLRAGPETPTMSGWCSGSCGYVFLWTAAHRALGEPRYLALALAAAWDAWDAPEAVTTLCCGLGGRAYALLNLYRHAGEAIWLDRARDLARRAATRGQTPEEYPWSLYKGGFGLAVLAADLERPEASAMPLFEPAGWRGAPPGRF